MHGEHVGQILTLETLSVPNLHGRLDGRVTRWSENVDDDIPYSFAIRVFHCRSLEITSRHFNEHALLGQSVLREPCYRSENRAMPL